MTAVNTKTRHNIRSLEMVIANTHLLDTLVHEEARVTRLHYIHYAGIALFVANVVEPGRQ